MLLKVEKLIKLYKVPIFGGVAKELNYLLGVDIPRCVVIGKNAVVGANTVLLNSIGDNEIWAGVPARFIGMREIDADMSWRF